MARIDMTPLTARPSGKRTLLTDAKGSRTHLALPTKAGALFAAAALQVAISHQDRADNGQAPKE